MLKTTKQQNNKTTNNMKKTLYSMLALAAGATVFTACEDKLDIEQKGVTDIANFYKTDADAEAALAAAYADFATNVPGRGAGFIYTPYKFMLNNGGDDMFAAGSNFGDNDFSAAINEYRLDSGLGIVNEFYSGLFQSVYTCNLVIDNFKNGTSAVQKRCVAEARVLRAYDYLLLTMLWGTPPFVDHLLAADALPTNSDLDPENPKSHEELLQWVADECNEAANDMDERKSTADKDGAVKATKGFAWAVAGKALLFKGDAAGAKTALKKVVDSGKYALVPGDRYWENFHIAGDCNEEKVFETNLEFNSGIGAWGGINQRSTWMEANIWNWRSDHFVAGASPQQNYTGGCDGWGGLGVPQWFGDEFFANDGHSYRFDVTLKHIDDAVYNMEYSAVEGLTLEQKKTSTAIGIIDPEQGLYGESCWLPFKQMIHNTDVNLSYGNNVRLNNNLVMRYAEVLFLYAEACLNSGDNGAAKDAVNAIRTRAGLSELANVDMNVLKKEKSYELWLEGCRWIDLVRWGDTDRVKKAGNDVPKLFDKVHRGPAKSGEKVSWENDRFYTVSTHEAQDAGYKTGYQDGKNNLYPFPMTVIEKNPNIRQNPGWE